MFNKPRRNLDVERQGVTGFRLSRHLWKGFKQKMAHMTQYLEVAL